MRPPSTATISPASSPLRSFRDSSASLRAPDRAGKRAKTGAKLRTDPAELSGEAPASTDCSSRSSNAEIIPMLKGTKLHSVAASELQELDRIVELDGVRGLALAMVLWIHCFLVRPNSIIAKLADSIGGSMYISLDLFFVLSGFLITSVLIRTRDSEYRARNFYARRFLRIFPAYYFVLVFIFFVYPVFYAPLRESQAYHDAIYFFTYVQNFWQAWKPGKGNPAWPGLEHLWSMAIEEQFYLVWPLVVWYTPPRRLVQTCALVCAISVAIKVALLLHGTTVREVYLPTYCRLEGLAGGAALASLWQTHGLRSTPRWMRNIGMVATAALLFLIFRKYTHKAFPKDMVAHTVVATIVFCWMIFAVVTAPKDALIRRFFRNRVLRFLGRYSYGIYLIHYVVYWQIKYAVLDAFGQTADHASNNVANLAGVLIIASTIPLAVVMYRLIEEPALRLKRHFISNRPALPADSHDLPVPTHTSVPVSGALSVGENGR
jgi:peptidoglycan/LPS O-acetylase OafA/YrhL